MTVRPAVLATAIWMCWTSAAGAQAPAAAVTDPQITALVGAISERRLEELLHTLVGFGTRNTLSDTTSTTRGIGAARQWILDELKRSSAKLHISSMW